MDKFIGRREELASLKELYDRKGFQMAVLFGRRRVGKTTLLNRFIETNKCKAISFVSTEMTESELLERMGNDVLESLSPSLNGKLKFDSFDSIFDYLAEESANEKIVFVIDEYPYLAKSCPYMNSLLQKYIDTKWKKSNLYFILLGSLVSFMREDVLGASAPLHGRANLEFKISPFNYKDTALFVPEYSAEEKAIVYGLTGGVAKYIEQFDSKISLDENIEKLFFSRNAFFSEEQIKTVITGEKSNPVAYNSIIDAIANGKTKYNEIQSATGMSDISFCLKNLISAEIVERRETPKPYYLISDSMVNFYFQFVAPGASLINSGKGRIYYEKKVKQNLHQFMGSVFERMAKDYILANVGTDKIPCFLTDVVEYQNSVKVGKEIKHVEIDLLGLYGKNYVLAGECKFKSEKFDKEEFDTFMDKLNYLPAANPKVMLFSLSGFTDYVIENSNDFTLVTLEKMY
ncbi:MAG: AAA family ATPase [Treponema sp.]|uniref:ATP-binding protein n=1 Tax=Treponema sp. TaxID=166 RepID=UPI0025CBB529|nr:ATP-binding protein [Treponema sp.]MBQ9282386.1 AAA family ATPase [Treponema sp.]MBR1714429.1 AAA family ATPase [Treponema sp.]